MIDGVTIFAWFVLALLFLVAVALIVALGSLPKQIAVKRGHPQVAAINAASWIGLALMGVGWPIAFVWAFVETGSMRNDGSQGDSANGNRSAAELEDEIRKLRTQVAGLEGKLQAQVTEKG